MSVDEILDDELLRLTTSYIGFGLVIRYNEFDRSAVNAARLIDAVDGHLRAH